MGDAGAGNGCRVRAATRARCCSSPGRDARPVASTSGSALTAPSVRLAIAGTASLRSALPLGFVPRVGATAPVLLTGDARGLDALRGLDAIYRTDSWVTPLGVSSLHAWQLAPLARRLRAAQQQLLATNSAFSMSAPFTAIAAARSEADATPHRLWLAGGGAAAALIMFVVLAAGALHRDRDEELDPAAQRRCSARAARRHSWPLKPDC